jgi:hypothetical protein
MDMISLQGKTNFIECHNVDCALSGVGARHNHEFSQIMPRESEPAEDDEELSSRRLF